MSKSEIKKSIEELHAEAIAGRSEVFKQWYFHYYNKLTSGKNKGN